MLSTPPPLALADRPLGKGNIPAYDLSTGVHLLLKALFPFWFTPFLQEAFVRPATTLPGEVQAAASHSSLALIPMHSPHARLSLLVSRRLAGGTGTA